MKKVAVVSLIVLFFALAYAFTPRTAIVVNPEVNSSSMLDDTIKTAKSEKKKTSKKNYRKDCSLKCDSQTAKTCNSSKETKKKKKEDKKQ